MKKLLLFFLFSSHALGLTSMDSLNYCGEDGRDNLVSTYCNSDLNIVQWKIGAKSFEKFHNDMFFQNNRWSPKETYEKMFQNMESLYKKHGGVKASFAYYLRYLRADDMPHLREKHKQGPDSCVLLYGPYIDIPKAGLIRYEVNVWANLGIHSDFWDRDKYPNLFRLELFSEGKVLDSVPVSWKLYHEVANFARAGGYNYVLTLSGDGEPSRKRWFDNYRNIRGRYVSKSPLKNVELRITEFHHAHSVFHIKDMGIEVIYGGNQHDEL